MLGISSLKIRIILIVNNIDSLILMYYHSYLNYSHAICVQCDMQNVCPFLPKVEDSGLWNSNINISTL
jgi:hypothetical protein